MLGHKAGSPALVLVPVCIAQFMAPFMLTAVGVALPSLGREFGASAVQLGLVEQLYVLSVAMVVLTFGRLGDIVGQRRVFLPGLVVFTTLTWSLGFTQSVGMVMAQRFGQGVGVAMMLSGSLALVAAAYPPQLRGRTIGFVSACTYAGLSTGPVIGGYPTSHAGWRSIFWLAVPLGLAAIGLGVVGMPAMPPNAAGERMDWVGSLAYGGSVGLVMLGAAHVKELPGGPGRAPDRVRAELQRAGAPEWAARVGLDPQLQSLLDFQRRQCRRGRERRRHQWHHGFRHVGRWHRQQ